MTVVFVAITGVHAAAAWASDGGTAIADAGEDADVDAATDGGVAGEDPGVQCGQEQSGPTSAVLFGAGCC